MFGGPYTIFYTVYIKLDIRSGFYPQREDYRQEKQATQENKGVKWERQRNS